MASCCRLASSFWASSWVSNSSLVRSAACLSSSAARLSSMTLSRWNWSWACCCSLRRATCFLSASTSPLVELERLLGGGGSGSAGCPAAGMKWVGGGARMGGGGGGVTPGRGSGGGATTWGGGGWPSSRATSRGTCTRGGGLTKSSILVSSSDDHPIAAAAALPAWTAWAASEGKWVGSVSGGGDVGGGLLSACSAASLAVLSASLLAALWPLEVVLAEDLGDIWGVEHGG